MAAKAERSSAMKKSDTEAQEINELLTQSIPKCTNGCMKKKQLAGETGKRNDPTKRKVEQGKDEPCRNTSSTPVFLRVRTFVACLSLLQLVQVMGSGYSKSALTSIERRYRLNSFSIGVLQSCFHIGNLSVILFVSYYGSKWHRPRAIAIGSLMMAASSLISCMPQFVGNRYDIEYTIPKNGALTRQVVLMNLSPVQSNRNQSDSKLQNAKNEAPTGNEAVMIVSNLTAFLISNDTSMLSGLRRVANVTDIEKLRRTLQLWSAQMQASQVSSESTMSQVSSSRQLHLASTRELEQDSDRNPEAEQIEDFSLTFTNTTSHQLCKPALMPEVDWAAIQSIRKTELTTGDNSGDDSFLYVFIAVGSVLKGMGHSPLHPLGMSFIDDFASCSNSAVYIGVVSALSLLGPAFGFILGSLTTNIWVDSGWVNTTNIPVLPQDSLWVGAWWMGYLITGILLVVVTIPFCAFARVIAKEEEQEEDDSTPCVTCIKVYFSDHDESESSDDAEVSSSAGDEELPGHQTEENVALTHDRYSRVEGTSQSMDFTPQRRDNDCRFSAYSEAIQKPNGKVVCYLGADSMRTKSVGDEKQATHGHRRFRRSASAPAIHGSNKRRVSRAYSIHQTDCLINKGVWGRTVNTLNNSPSTASLKDFAFTMKGLLRDPVFISITLGFVSLTSFLAASITYASKYMETQFDLSASRANLLNGCVNLPMAVVGNILGGWIIRRRNLTVKRTLNVVLLALLMTSIAVAILLFLGCEEAEVVGLKSSAPSPCIDSCACTDTYSPVCDVAVNITYRSACHAGCTQMHWKDGIQIFTDCRCLAKQQVLGSLDLGGSGISIQPGACPQPSCWQRLAIFVAVMGTASMTAGISSTPSTLTILKVVPPADKAFAIGIVFVFTRVLAWIPAPVYVGSAIDTACLLWIDSSQDLLSKSSQQHCEIYDKRRLRQTFFGCTSLQLFFGCCFYSLALYLVTRRDKERGKLQHGTNV